ncbi:MAG: DUF1697 domain-containing protein [Bacteroidetes bacterium]|nr:DUF1697 domain-containing protein [Bacteroidota bacterium]MCL6097517.1 DUF1697 domain-containing protein [Bacteroidota bacterium]
MQRYIAFLRGINVGGKNIIKMDALGAFFSSLGFKNVKTFIQSGNVFFDSATNSSDALTKKIETGLMKEYGSNIKVMIRTVEETKKMLTQNPFVKMKPSNKIKFYVCFLDREPKTKPKLPLISEKEALTFFKLVKRDAFMISKQLKGGRYGFPTIFLEKELGVFATARNWNTVCKMMDSIS